MFKVCIAIYTLLAFLFISPFSLKALEQPLMTIDKLQSIGFSKYESINPDSLIYMLKRVGEKTKSLFISGQENKIKYSFELLNARFCELVFIANNQKSGFFTETVNRYNTSIGQIKSANTQAKYQVQISKYLTILETLRDRHPANSAYWLILQQAVDTTKSIL